MSAESIVQDVSAQIAEYVAAVNDTTASVSDTISSNASRFYVNPGAVNIDTVQLSNVITQLGSEVSRIQSLANDLLGQMPSMDFPTEPVEPALVTIAAPTLMGSPAAFPTAPAFSDASAPSAPNLSVPSAPTLNGVVVPTAPAITLPTAPTLNTNIVLPTAPNIILPSWDASFVPPMELKPLYMDLSALTPEADEKWTSPEHTQLLALIDHGVNVSALPGTEELALYERARNRLLDEYEDVRTQTSQRFAALNYPAPPGAQLAALQRLSEKQAIELANINVSIMDTQLKQRIQAQEFYTELLYKVEDQAQKWLGDVRMRIQSMLAKNIDAQVQQYNASLQMVGAAVEVYKAELSAFSEQVRAAALAIDIYRSELEGAKLLGELNQQEVDLYRALISAQESLVGIYNSQLQAVDAQVKVQLAEVSVYNAQLEGVKATASVYESQVKSFGTSVQANAAKSDIYATQVSAWKTGEDVRLKQFDAAIVGAETASKLELTKMAAYNSSIDAFKAKIDAIGLRLEAWGKNAAVITSTGNTVIGALGAMGDAAAKSADLAVQQSNSINRVLVDSATANAAAQAAYMNATVAALRVQGDAAQQGIAALGQMGAGITLKVE
jgi:hypothetical protein